MELCPQITKLCPHFQHLLDEGQAWENQRGFSRTVSCCWESNTLPRAVVGSDARRSVGTLRFSSSPTCWFALEWTQAGLALAQTLMSGLFTPLLLSLTPGPIVLPFGLLKQKMMQQMHSHEGTEIKISQMRSGGGEEGSQTSLPAFGGASKARGGDALE